LKLNDILTPSFRDFHQKAARRPMIQVAYDSDLCQEVVANGWLSEGQMRHAAERYRLGKSRSGKCIYWMVDEMMQVRDGHLGDSWVSQLLRAREPELMQWFQAKHCLFGLHLLSVSSVCHISIVESERAAVILSEIFPESLWLAYAYPANMTPNQLEPLQGHSVTIYPRTDPEMDIYVSFLEFADDVRRLFDIDLTVDNLLEEHATTAQKERNIDLLDFILEK
jgi:hypothetical protein